MRNVRWEAESRNQYREILSYIADRNAVAADKLEQEVFRKLNLLKSFPEIGRIGRVERTRELIIHPNYLLIYVLRPETIDIIRFIHARQRYP